MKAIVREHKDETRILQGELCYSCLACFNSEYNEERRTVSLVSRGERCLARATFFSFYPSFKQSCSSFFANNLLPSSASLHHPIKQHCPPQTLSAASPPVP